MENHFKYVEITQPDYFKPSTPEHWRVLLAEFVHLLGILLIHSRHTQSVRATSVLFDQMMRHLSVLEKMPGHEGALMMGCSKSEGSKTTKGCDYRILFGNITIQRFSHDKDAPSITGKHANYLNKALDQTFGYLSGYGIESLYLQLPGDSKERIDQLRLALNIIARFRDAVDNKGSVTFRYGDRAFAFPLIYNPQGQPDYNLTLLAGINGLSAANTDELIKQAKAFHDIALAANVDDSQQYKVVKDSYDQIFKVRSLRSQIIKPLVEVNNIPWVGTQPAHEENVQAQTTAEKPATMETAPDTGIHGEETAHAKTLYVIPSEDNWAAAAETRQYLAGHLAGNDPKVELDLDAVIIEDFRAFHTQALGERLVAASRLLYAIDNKCQDPEVGDRLLYFLQFRLLQVSDEVLANIEVLLQGLRIFVKGRAVVVGLVHPRLVDMITLVKDQVITRHKTAVIKKIAFTFDRQHAELIVEPFDISVEHAQNLLALFRTCFDNQGGFHRDVFESRIDDMAQQANTFFEVNWCFLKETPLGKDRLAFINALQLLMARLEDPERALRFLLDDLFRHPNRVDYTDRNIFVLGNILMQAENKSLDVDLDKTPDTVLCDAQNVDRKVHRYTIWRINTDQIRVVNKLKTIHNALEQALKMSIDDKNISVDFLLALEREALFFLALVNGPTARRILSDLLKHYGDPGSEIYSYGSESGRLSDIMAQLQIVVRCMGCVGYTEDIALLEAVSDNTDIMLSLDSHPAYSEQIKQTMKWVPESIKKIQAQAS